MASLGDVNILVECRKQRVFNPFGSEERSSSVGTGKRGRGEEGKRRKVGLSLGLWKSYSLPPERGGGETRRALNDG